MTKFISMVSSKGGVGKSTMVYNIAKLLTGRGNSVLLIDADEQGNLSEMFPKEFDKAKKSIKSILFEGTPASQVINQVGPNLYMIFADLELGLLKNDLHYKTDRYYILLTWVQQNKDVLNQFDYVLIDLHPEISVIQINSFIISDVVVSPINTDKYGETSLKLLDTRYNLLNDLTVHPVTQTSYLTARIKYFINKYNQQKVKDRKRYENIRNHPLISGEMFKGFIPEREVISNTLEYEAGISELASLTAEDIESISDRSTSIASFLGSALLILMV